MFEIKTTSEISDRELIGTRVKTPTVTETLYIEREYGFSEQKDFVDRNGALNMLSYRLQWQYIIHIM